MDLADPRRSVTTTIKDPKEGSGLSSTTTSIFILEFVNHQPTIDVSLLSVAPLDCLSIHGHHSAQSMVLVHKKLDDTIVE